MSNKLQLIKLLNKADKVANNLEGLYQDLASKLQECIYFECHVTSVGGDGIVVGDIYGNVAPAIDAIIFISKNKTMDYSQFKSICI